ncbi:MAG: helical backbone metal receptor [Candidatus Omnitrophota bacterium]
MNLSKLNFIYAAIFIFLCDYGYTQDKLPSRIISLSPALTEGIYALGAQDKLIADTIYCTRPAFAKEKEKIGTLTGINIEKVLAMKPDLVLVTTMLSDNDKNLLRNFNINTAVFAEPVNFDDLCEQFIRLGGLIGKRAEAEEMIGDVKNEINEIRGSVSSKAGPKVFVQIGAKPLFTVNKNSFVNDLIEFSGAVNIAKDSPQGIYSREEVLRKNPDIIIIASMGIIQEEEMKLWRSFESIGAVKNNRIHFVCADVVTRPNPAAFLQALKEFVKIIHPDNE